MPQMTVGHIAEVVHKWSESRGLALRFVIVAGHLGFLSFGIEQFDVLIVLFSNSVVNCAH